MPQVFSSRTSDMIMEFGKFSLDKGNLPVMLRKWDVTSSHIGIELCLVLFENEIRPVLS